MIHLDTNLLIGAEDPSDAHHQTTRRVLARPDSFACSAVAWMEFLSYPGVPQPLQEALKSLLAGGIVPFDEATAALAGAIFHLTGAHRRTRLDTMIAATAIHAGAALAHPL
ncbi:MAG: PIN domain-containing protein [Verrucomicrobia bacterium]|nr:PIN domain-containing protein [Verrucomicrobiota bacterium]